MGLMSFLKGDKKDCKKEDIAECHIDVNTVDCDGCEKCGIACPNNVFILDGDVIVVRDSQVCKSCKVCMAICPNDCITVN